MAHTALARRAAAASLLLTVVVLLGCKQMAPTVEVHSITVQRLDLESAGYLVVCEATNPNDWPMRIDELTWTLATDGRELLSGAVVHPTELLAKSSSPFTLAMNLPYRLLSQAGVADCRQFPFRFQAKAQFAGSMGPIEVPFERAGAMPVIHALTVELANMELLGVTESKVGLSLAVKVTNTNDLHLIPSQLTGQIFINEQPMIDLNVEPDAFVSLAPGASADLRFVVWVRSPVVGVRTLAQLLGAPDSRCRLVGAMQIRLPGNGDISDLLASPAE